MFELFNKERVSIGRKWWFYLLFPVGLTLAYIGIVLLFDLITDNIYLSQFLGDMLLAVLGLSFYIRALIQQRRSGIKRSSFKPHMWAVFGGMCAVILVWFMVQCVGMTIGLHYDDAVYTSSVSQMADANVFLLFVLTCFAAPLVEETIYRLFIYTSWKKCMPLFPAMILSALIFAVMHGNLTQGVCAFMFGMFNACLFEITGHIMYPVLAHMLFNFMSWANIYELPDSAASSFLFSIPCAVIMFAILFGICILCTVKRETIRTYVTSNHLIDKLNRPWGTEWDDEMNDIKK